MIFKDADPEDTLARIYSILDSANLVINEVVVEPIHNIFSVMININNTSIFSNGKGDDILSAKASAYGELVERLDNLIHFRACFVHSILRSRSYRKYFPTDVYVKSLSENQKNKWISAVFDDSGAAKITEILSRSSNQNSYIYSCFQSIDDDNDKIFIPYSLLDYFYGSNGMAAGNSIEEAFVQAVSETIERYSIREIILNRNVLGLTDITKLVRNKYSQLNDYILTLEEKGFTTKVLDYSLNGNFPVIVTIFFNRNNLEYFLKFGCHPDLFIATLRTFTEFLQNRDPNSMDSFVSLSSDIDNIDSSKNFSSIFHDGKGVYPYEIFCSPPATRLPVIWNIEFRNNYELARYYKSKFKSINKKIYFAKRKYLGFDTIQVVIPGFSEVSSVRYFVDLENTENVKKNILLYVKLCNGTSTTHDIQDLISFWESTLKAEGSNFLTWFRIPLIIKPDPIYTFIEGHYILTILYLLIGELNQAYSHSIEWLKKNQANKNEKLYKYVNDLSSVLFLENHNFDDKEIESFSESFNLDTLFREAYDDITQKRIFNMIPIISCPNCCMCDFMGECKFENEDIVLRTILSRT